MQRRRTQSDDLGAGCVRGSTAQKLLILLKKSGAIFLE
jgi:hypothetical protein